MPKNNSENKHYPKELKESILKRIESLLRSKLIQSKKVALSQLEIMVKTV